MRPAISRNPGRIPAVWWLRPRRCGKASTLATRSPTSPTAGGFEGRKSEDQMQLFAEEVMPVIARECGGKVTCRSTDSGMLSDKSGRSPRNGRPATSSYGKVGNPGWPANSRNN